MVDHWARSSWWTFTAGQGHHGGLLPLGKVIMVDYDYWARSSWWAITTGQGHHGGLLSLGKVIMVDMVILVVV